ncbi:MASE1 domain-containing protein [Dyella choica]|nr:MASE1 domain-containing protein [Dyella choica]
MWKRHGWSMLWQATVTVGYLALYALIRPLSDAHWQLTAGLRLGLLLLLPYRYWLALVIADTAASAYQSYLDAPRFGVPWAIASSLPLIAFAMPVVWLCREKLALFPSRRLVNFPILLLCALLVSAIWSLVKQGAMVLAKSPGVEITPMILIYLFVGAYVALLTTIPWVVIAKLDYRPGTPWKRLRGFIQGSLALEAAGLLIPMQLILSWLAFHANEQKPVYCLFMFMPVAWLTLKHGWRAAVLGGTFVVACICVLMNYDTPDPMVLQVQAIIAFAITCLIAMGARISAMHQREERERIDVKRAMRLARQSLYVGEMRLRQASETLEHVNGELQLSQNRLLHRFQVMLPANESRMYSKQAATLRDKVQQIAATMHPIAWRRKDLPAALRENIGDVLNAAGIAYSYQIRGRGFGFGMHSSNLHTAIYRLACESVVYICTHMRCSHLRLTLRGVEIGDHRLVVLRVEGALGSSAFGALLFVEGERDRLAQKLGATRLELVELKDHANLFNGELHTRIKGDKLRLTFLLHDIPEMEQERLSTMPPPLRLWAH